jgi:protein phosphatase 1 regulatory subunit 12A
VNLVYCTFRTAREPPVAKRRSRMKYSEGCVFLAACNAEDREEVLTLVKRGVDIDTANIDGLTALHQVRH